MATTLKSEVEITVTVQISIPVSMTFDEAPSMGEIRSSALENFMHHPALKNIADLEMYVDSIGNGEIDVTNEKVA